MPKEIEVKSILNKTKRRDPWFLDDYTVNPYSSCSFNCLYCYIRGSKYGLNLEESLSVKINAEELLEKQLSLRAKKGQYGFIVLSSATDPYLYIEKKYELTRKLLEIIAKYKFPVHIITKSDLIIRDFDILEEISNKAILPADLKDILPHKLLISFSFSSLNEDISNIFEPGAPSTQKRLLALKASKENNFHAGISLMPVLPYISDTEENLTNMFMKFNEFSASYVLPAGLTLFGEQSTDSKFLILETIQKDFPHLLGKYKDLYEGSSNNLYNYQTLVNKKILSLMNKHQLKIKIL